MGKIIRTKREAKGGITAEEKARMDEHVQMWIKRAFRTDPIEPEKIIPAIEGLYEAAGLKKPRVVIVPSPHVMAFSYGASAAILYRLKNVSTATYDATAAATRDATRVATAAATAAATVAATYDATYDATRDATDAAEACFELAGNLGIECAKLWSKSYQGGNMWSAFDCYLTALRDILGLDLPEHAKYRFWEQATIHGGFRVMHEDFCIVSDFPERILVDEQNRPHCENGPSHRWRDGWSLYHWHGVKVPAHWIEDRANLDPNEVIKCENVEQRAAGAEIVGWPKMLDVLKVTVINDSGNEDIGQLIELKLPGLNNPGRFLKARCPRNGIIVEGVPYESDIDGLPINTALAAQAWRIGDAQSEYIHPEKRT